MPPDPQPDPAIDALAARREVRDSAGNPVGYEYAVAPIDERLLNRLSVAAGVTVTRSQPPAGVETLALAPDSGQPLALYLSVPPARPAQMYPVLLATLLTATIAGGALSRWLGGVVAGQYDGVVTELRQAEHLSVTDELTGLWNVRHLGESVRLEVVRASRFGRALGVLALDLDRFKEVNDRFGHRAGDAVLAEFARRIRAVVREVDLVFRQGGEEFVVLLPETDLNGSATAARRVGAAIRQTPFTILARRPDGPVSIKIPITRIDRRRGLSRPCPHRHRGARRGRRRAVRREESRPRHVCPGHPAPPGAAWELARVTAPDRWTAARWTGLVRRWPPAADSLAPCRRTQACRHEP